MCKGQPLKHFKDLQPILLGRLEVETPTEKVVVIGYVQVIQPNGACCSIKVTRQEMVRQLKTPCVGKHTKRRLVFCRPKSTEPFLKPFSQVKVLMSRFDSQYPNRIGIQLKGQSTVFQIQRNAKDFRHCSSQQLPKPIEIYGTVEVASLYCAVNILISRL